MKTVLKRNAKKVLKRNIVLIQKTEENISKSLEVILKSFDTIKETQTSSDKNLRKMLMEISKNSRFSRSLERQ